MISIKNKFARKIIAILIILVIANFAADIVIKSAAVVGARAVTGIRMGIGNLSIGIVNTAVRISHLVVYNPAGFKDKILVDIPEIYVNYNPMALLKGTIHIQHVKLDLKEMMIVKNAAGKVNINELVAKKEGAAPKKKSAMMKFRIDVLEYKVGKIIYKDYSSGGKPGVKVFNVNIDEKIYNITDPGILAGIVMTRALYSTTLGQIVDMGALSKGVDQALEQSKKAAAKTKEAIGNTIQGTKDTLKGTTDSLKGLFKK